MGEQDSQRHGRDVPRELLRNKIPELQQALQGRVTAHHRFLLRELLDHLYFVESKMRRIEQEVAGATSALFRVRSRGCARFREWTV